MNPFQKPINWRRVGVAILAFGLSAGVGQAQVDLDGLARQLGRESTPDAPLVMNSIPAPGRAQGAAESPRNSLVETSTGQPWRFPETPEELATFAELHLEGRDLDPAIRLRRICQLILDMQGEQKSAPPVDMALCYGVGEQEQ